MWRPPAGARLPAAPAAHVDCCLGAGAAGRPWQWRLAGSGPAAQAGVRALGRALPWTPSVSLILAVTVPPGCAGAWHVCGGHLELGEGWCVGGGGGPRGQRAFVPEAAQRAGLSPDKEQSVCRGRALGCCHNGPPGAQAASALSPLQAPLFPGQSSLKSQWPLGRRRGWWEGCLL